MGKFEPGHKKRGGRKRGTPNKHTSEVRAQAMLYTAEAIEKLVALMRKGKTEQVRIMACRELLDRACGKPVQPLASDQENPFALLVQHLDGLTRGVPSQYRRASEGH